jgi:hypothetical protein
MEVILVKINSLMTSADSRLTNLFPRLVVGVVRPFPGIEVIETGLKLIKNIILNRMLSGDILMRKSSYLAAALSWVYYVIWSKSKLVKHLSWKSIEQHILDTYAGKQLS